MRRWALAIALSTAGCGASILTDGTDAAVVDPDGGEGEDAGADLSAGSDAGKGCTSSADCAGGVCVAGACCPSMAAVCGGACCTGGMACLFDRCVLPGKPCHTANDCPPDHYCEPGLGGAPDGGPRDGGAADGGVACTQPIPPEGRCLSLPPKCAPDGGAPDGGCTPPCEYRPTPGQKLEAIAEWSWGPVAKEFPAFTDVWSTPAIGRVADANCDGKVDELDPPNVVFVSGNVAPSNSPRNNGVLRMLDGRSGKEVWSLQRASMGSLGFMGFSVAIGDVDGNGSMDVVAVTGERYVVLISSAGKVLRTSNMPIPHASSGWGGGPSIGDMDNDGFPEIVFGSTVFSTTNMAITLRWTGAQGTGGGNDEQLSALSDLTGDGKLELVAGRTAYRADGTTLWHRNDLPEGFPGVGDLDKDGKPEVVLVASGQLWLLDGATGQTRLGPLLLPGTGSGGPPTVADFDGDGRPEIGVAKANFYSVVKPDFAGRLNVLWQTPNHDLSSSVTGSSVFDFEGDGRAEVVYGDECYLWVFDGRTGAVRFAAFTTSFTATEASVVADVDGDGHAELVMVSNGASPVSWGCMTAQGAPTTVNGVTWKPGPAQNAYRGITVFGDKAGSWVGTRTLWNQHTYHVSNVCDSRDSACDPPNRYGGIPKVEKRNWNVTWLNNFRQNVQDRGLFDAPDATVTLAVDCVDPVVLRPTVRNAGLTPLPVGVDVELFLSLNMSSMSLGRVATTVPLWPGQGQQLQLKLAPGVAKPMDLFYARVVVDPMNPKFYQCRADNDQSALATASCIQ